MDQALLDLCPELCARVDWPHPGLAGTPALSAWQAGDNQAAALGFIRYLRTRERPLLGYTADWVALLRERATPAYLQQAEETLRPIREAPLEIADWHAPLPVLFGSPPELLQVAAREEDFLRQARQLALAREHWSSPETLINGLLCAVAHLVHYLQAVCPLAECPDEALLPLLTALPVKFEAEWGSARHWSDCMLGTGGHNWWVGEFGALWKAALLFPELTGLGRLQPLLPGFFEREIALLSYPDGFTHECSVSYHIWSLDLFLDASRLGELNGVRFSEAFYQRLRAWAAVGWKLMQPDGNYPAFGDGHGVGPLLRERLRSLAALLGSGEARYLAELTDPTPAEPFSGLLLSGLLENSVGEDLLPAYSHVAPLPPATLDASLPAAGYFAQRSGWDTRADFAALEASLHGPVVTSHGHTALFDLMLCARGRAILVGNGKGPESDLAEPRRAWRTTTAAHSTATVDGLDHVPLRSVYRFSTTVVPTVVDWLSTEASSYFSGVHEAYERLEHKVTGSRRKLFYLRDEYWILLDRFTTERPEHVHTYRQHFQVLPEVNLGPGECAWTLGEGGNLLFCPVATPDLSAASLAPCPQPLEGYHNPGQLCFTREAAGSTVLPLVLVPFTGADRPELTVRSLPVEADGRTLAPWEATGLEITLNGRRDLYVDLHMPWTLPWRCADYSGAARLFHSRCPQ